MQLPRAAAISLRIPSLAEIKGGADEPEGDGGEHDLVAEAGLLPQLEGLAEVADGASAVAAHQVDETGVAMEVGLGLRIAGRGAVELGRFVEEAPRLLEPRLLAQLVDAEGEGSRLILGRLDSAGDRGEHPD